MASGWNLWVWGIEIPSKKNIVRRTKLCGLCVSRLTA